MEEKYFPCCGKRCDLSAPRCPRGEEYARTGQIPQGHGDHDSDNHSHHGEGHREHHHHEKGRHEHYHDHHEEGHREHHHHEEGRHEHHHDHHRPRHKSPLDSQRYHDLSTEDKLTALLQALGHMGRFGHDGKGSQTRILTILSREGTMTQRDLTERLGIQPGSASEIIGKLERAGLIVRTPSSVDRRTVDISLTEEGISRVEAQPKDAANSMFSALTEEEKDTLLGLLEKLSKIREDQQS